MRGHLVRWVIAVMATGAVAIAGSVLTAPRNERGLSTAAPAVTKATSTSTTTAAPPTTAATALPTTTATEPPSPTTSGAVSTTVPQDTVPPDTVPPETVPPASEISDAPPPATAVPLPEVAIYGDSLTVAAWPRYQELTSGEVDTHPHAFAGAALPHWSAAIQSDTVDRLVLALGTNDAQNDGARPWAELFDALPDTKCIVWPKPYEGSNAVKVFNTEMTAIVAAHPNVHVVDWDVSVQAHPEWVSSDHVHYTDEGNDQYAAMLRQAALTCP